MKYISSEKKERDPLFTTSFLHTVTS